MTGSREPRPNHLLAALSPAERDRLFPHLQLVRMPIGAVVHEAGDPLKYVHFPTDGVLSLLFEINDGRSIEIAVVGSEGIVGLDLSLGGEIMPSRAIVQTAGHAYRLEAARLSEEYHRHGNLQILILRYMQALITQMAQVSRCSNLHSLEQQLCRWLLISLDRQPSIDIPLSTDFIATMLGQGRDAVNAAADRLHASGVISYHSGSFTVRDRSQLATMCCGCYAVAKQATDSLRVA